MMSRLGMMCLISLISLFLIGVVSPRIYAQRGGATRPELKGIGAVYVVVEELSDSAKSLGLEARDIETDVDLKLLMGGMHVVSREEGLKLSGRPFIYVRVTVTMSGEAGYAAVELDEDAQLDRNNQRAARVTTWDTGTITAHPTGKVIRDVVKDDVEVFLNDWRAANPTK